MCPSILIVDGNRWHRETLTAALAYEGYYAEHTGDGARAIITLQDRTFHLVLLDPSGATTGGWELFEVLTRLHTRLPVVVVATGQEQLAFASVAGASAALGKPINFPALLRAIKRALAEPPEIHAARLAGRWRRCQVIEPTGLQPKANRSARAWSEERPVSAVGR